jgi:hypothetical protein
MFNLQYDATTIRLPDPMPPNHDSITDFCEHDASDPRPHHLLVYVASCARARDGSPGWGDR